MSSIFDIKVSGYANYYSTEPKPVNLFKWLTSIKYAHKVQAIRSSTDKKKRNKLKAGLPAVIPSGTFEGGKEMEHFVRHSGFITIDIDGEDHKNLHNFGDLKCLLSNIPEIAYCGLSVSGNGYWGLVKIAYPERHKEHYFALENAFSRYGINLDAQCKNINRLRGYSFDPDTYFNEYAPIFYHLASEPVSTNKELQHQPKQILQNKPQLLDNRDKIETLIEKLEENQIDITGSYATWRNIGIAMISELGESGLVPFHRVSYLYDEYNPRETEYQYSAWIKAGLNQVGIGYFYSLCYKAGIR